MDDLISRQAALEKVRAMQTYKLFEGDDMILIDKAEVQTELMMLPSVQPEVLACGNGELVVQPEPHEGEWVNGRCNKCGGHAPFWCMASTYHGSKYCPECGAKMKGATP